MENRIFITGCAGFIGYHAALRFHERGDEVLGYDNFNDYYDVSLKEARVANLLKSSVNVIKGDICDRVKLQQVLDKFKPTHILHLAARAGVRNSSENPLIYAKSNLEGFVVILEETRRLKVKLIYASSSSVYGENKMIPFREDDRTDLPASFYGATKKAGEIFATAYHSQYKLDMTGLRFFTVYGPWGRPDMAYFLFTKAILEGKPINVYNHGNMMRDFTYIDDIVSGIEAAVDRCAGNNVYNLGRGEPVKLGFFIETIEKALGMEADKKMFPMQLGDVKKTFADIDKSRKELGYEPKTSVQEGIERFVKWYKEYYSLGKKADVAADDAPADATVF